VPYQILLIPEIFFGGGGGFGFFLYEKGSKGKKGTFTRYVDFFKFLKLIFDRICIPPQKKDWGI
jgi:hypothetical protein